MKMNDLISAYIEQFQDPIRQQLIVLYDTILKTVPFAESAIRYGMPAFSYKGPLVYFAGYKNHIGFYPTASGISAFKNQLIKYKHSKGAIQFPIEDSLPLDLIIKIIEFRLRENEEKYTLKNTRTIQK